MPNLVSFTHQGHPRLVTIAIVNSHKQRRHPSTRMPNPHTDAIVPLTLAFSIVFITIVPTGCYILLKVWLYFLNSRFRLKSAALRHEWAEDATLNETKNRAIFVGFFHPYWYIRSSSLY
jgi:hypothetical protein